MASPAAPTSSLKAFPKDRQPLEKGVILRSIDPRFPQRRVEVTQVIPPSRAFHRYCERLRIDGPNPEWHGDLTVDELIEIQRQKSTTYVLKPLFEGGRQTKSAESTIRKNYRIEA